MDIIVLIRLFNACKFIVFLPQMGQLQTILILAYEIEYCNFQDVLSKLVHLTYDIEDIATCELTFNLYKTYNFWQEQRGCW